MKWYGWVLLIVVGGLIGFTTFVIARGAFHPHGPHMGWGGHGNGEFAGRDDHGHHGTRQLTQWLQTSTTQDAALSVADPKFTEEAATLAQSVRQERQKLLDTLSEPKSTDEQINAQVEQVLAAEAALQRRVTQYVIKARPVLSGMQQQQLLGLYGEHMGGVTAGHHHDVEMVPEFDRDHRGRDFPRPPGQPHGSAGGHHGDR